MKGSIGTATYLSYTRPYWGKVISRLNYIDKLSPKAKVKYKAINLYSSGDYSLEQICEIFEINRRTILFDGFSKTYTITGWRLGFVVMKSELATHFTRSSSH